MSSLGCYDRNEEDGKSLVIFQLVMDVEASGVPAYLTIISQHLALTDIRSLPVQTALPSESQFTIFRAAA